MEKKIIDTSKVPQVCPFLSTFVVGPQGGAMAGVPCVESGCLAYDLRPDPEVLSENPELEIEEVPRVPYCLLINRKLP